DILPSDQVHRHQWIDSGVDQVAGCGSPKIMRDSSSAPGHLTRLAPRRQVVDYLVAVTAGKQPRNDPPGFNLDLSPRHKLRIDGLAEFGNHIERKLSGLLVLRLVSFEHQHIVNDVFWLPGTNFRRSAPARIVRNSHDGL